MKLSEQLPTHSADPETWNRLSAKLDALDSEAVYQEKLQQLPVHSPDKGMWAIIQRRLTHTAYLKMGTRIILSAAAGLLLFFTVSRIVEYYPGSPATPKIARQEQPNTLPVAANHENPKTPKVTATRKTDTNSKPSPANDYAGYSAVIQQDFLSKNQKTTTNSGISKEAAITLTSSAGIKEAIPVEDQITTYNSNSLKADNNSLASSAGIKEVSPESIKPIPASADSNFALNILTPGLVKNKAESLTSPYTESHIPLNKSINAPVQFNQPGSQKGLVATPLLSAVNPSPPKDQIASGKRSRFAIAMGYLPENIYNGTNNSLFQNVDFTASYNKEKVRFNTSVGMAYNEDHYEVTMSYAIKSPVTAIGPGGKIDTLSYNSASLASEYVGSEKHQYFTYNLGMGRRLFSSGKFSTWIIAGAGFGVRLNNPDLVASSENSIKSQYNAQITRVNTSKPVYNDVNVNFVTGIDFNYKIFNRISITFTPTSRWYFKPVLSKNNQPTDELTIGFKTGMKFDF